MMCAGALERRQEELDRPLERRQEELDRLLREDKRN